MGFKIGMVTIGQAPRDDVVSDMRKFIPSGVEIIQKGALDGLTLSEVRRLDPKGTDDNLLITRMRDGTEVGIGESHILSRMQEKISELNREGVDLITLLCGGVFPDFESKKMMILPYKLISGVFSSLSISGRLGVLFPNEDQFEYAKEYFVNIGFSPEFVPASPYGDTGNILEAARRLTGDDIDAIVLWCFGYTLVHKKEVQNVTKKPVCHLGSLLARNLLEFIC
jgi:protein AroM